jgi:hypothetical protein
MNGRLDALIADESSKDRTGKTHWVRVGSAWPSKDGKGLTLVIPPGVSVSGRVVLREPLPRDGRRPADQGGNAVADDDGDLPF